MRFVVANPYGANLLVEVPLKDTDRQENVYIACKGACDRELQERLRARGAMSAWQDIGDLTNPVFYLKNMMGYINQLHEGRIKVSDQAHDRLKQSTSPWPNELYVTSPRKMPRDSKTHCCSMAYSRFL